MFAEDFAGDAAFDDAQRAAIFNGSKWFGVKRFLRGNPAGQEDINNRFGFAFFCRRQIGFCKSSGHCCRCAEVLSQRKTESAHQAYIQKFPSGRRPPMIRAAATGHRLIAHALPP